MAVPRPWTVDTRLDVVTRTEPLIPILDAFIVPATSSVKEGVLHPIPT